METLNGEWIMKGCDERDPAILRTPADALALIQTIGFLPLFSNCIPGFSLEEHVPAERWWTGNPQTDPWEWRAILSRDDRVAYGKFFHSAAGFISKDFFPIFANYRRNGYDFDALYEDGLAPHRCKKIMDALELDEDAVGRALLSTDLKNAAGFGKDREKNFPGILTQLQMQTYLILADFRQKQNKQGTPFGWHLAVVETPETKWGRAFVTSDYSRAPAASWKTIVSRVREHFPEAGERDIETLLGIRYPQASAPPTQEQKPAKAARRKTIRPHELPWPESLITEIGLSEVFPETQAYTPLSPDQMEGVAFALSQLKDREQTILRLRYEEHWKTRDIADSFGLSTARIQQICTLAFRKLRHPTRLRYLRFGKQGALTHEHQQTAAIRAETDREKKLSMLREIKINACGFSAQLYYWLVRCEIQDLGELARRMEQDPLQFMNNRYGEEHSLYELIERMEQYGVDCEQAREAYGFSARKRPEHIAELQLSVRVYNVLLRGGLTQISDIDRVIQTNPHRILKLNGLGAKSREELFWKLERIGIDCSPLKQALEEQERRW